MSQSAIIYARFSSTEQSKGYSLERQQTLATAFATQHGWLVEKTITDEGRSAFRGTNRLEGSALHGFELEARNGLHAGKVLVVENIDRLSRQGAKAAPLTKMTIAASRSVNDSLRLAKMVPLVTLNWWLQATHLKRRRDVMLYVSTQPHLGHTASPSVSAQRI